MPIDLGLAPQQREECNHPPEPQTDPIEDFRFAMLEHGLEPETIVPDESLHRFDTEKRGDKAGWYVFYAGDVCGGAFGDWRTGSNIHWRSNRYAQLSIEKKADYDRQHKERLQRIEQERAEAYERASQQYTEAFNRAIPASANHPYLVKKGVPVLGDVRQVGDELKIPVMDPTGKIWTLQRIFPDGSKRFESDGKASGGSFTIPGDNQLYICEGYATGASIHAATGGTVIIAFNAANLPKVARVVRDKCPADEITICGDDDRFTADNPGRSKAELAAKEIGAKAVFPTFKNLSSKPTDFNDLAVLEGIEAVKKAIDGTKVQGAGYQFIHGADLIKNLKPIEWTVDGIIPTYSFYYTFGDPGTLKSFIEIDRGHCIAAGIPWHGHATRQGTVFYICGEGQQGIGRRMLAWHSAHKTKPSNIPFFVAKTPMQLSDPANVEGVMRAIDTMAAQYGPPALVLIDTLARNFGDGDENSTRDMGIVIQNLDRFFGNDFCRGIIHHTGHLNKNRGRGSIALKGAVDTEFRCSITNDEKLLLECIKQKDAPEAPPMLFDRKKINLLINDSRDSSLVLNLIAEGEALTNAKEIKLSSQMVKILDILKQMGGEDFPVEWNEWRSRCIEKGIYKRTDVFDKSAEKIRKKGLIKTDLLKTEVFIVNHGMVEPGGK